MPWVEVDDAQIESPASGAGFHTDPQTGRQVLRINITGGQKRNGDEAAAEVPAGWKEVSDEEIDAPLAVERGTGSILEKVDALARGAADVVTFGLSDEIAAGLDTLFNDRSYEENLASQRAVDRFDEKEHGGARLAGQFGGGFLLPIARAATPGQLARTGAAYGGAYGFGSGEGGFANRASEGAVGAGVGALTGYGLGKVAQKLTRPKVVKDRVEANKLLKSFEQLGIEPIPAVVGSPNVQRATSVAAQMPLGTSAISKATQRMEDQALGARDRIAEEVGDVLPEEVLGENIRAGSERWIKATSARGRELYNKATELAGDIKVPPVEAKRVIASHIDDLSQTPGGSPALTLMQQLDSDLTGEFSVQGLRNLRTSMRDRLEKEGLRRGDAERRVNEVIDAVSADIVNGLRGSGRPEAAQAYSVADRYWKARLHAIDNVIQPIIGKPGQKSPEHIVRAITTNAKGNVTRLGAFMRVLDEPERQSLRATLISGLGRSSAGRQNAEGSAFSLAEFLTHWNQIKNPAAKRALFGDEGAAALSELAKVAEASKDAMKYANTSNTGGVVANVATFGGALLTGANPVGLLGIAATQILGAKALASPRVARWIARAPKDPALMRSHIEKLSRIAVREPALAPELTALQNALTEALARPSGSGLRAAASSDREDKPKDR